MTKKMLTIVFALLCASSVLAFDSYDSIVRWKNIVGVVTAPGVDNPIGAIHAGAGPWSVRSGRAQVNLHNGATFFDVEGLVLNGGSSSGTPGPITAVTGTLVCNSGTTTATVLDTEAVSIDVHGDARFAGQIAGVPTTCSNPVFLIRIAAPAGAAGRWIATGTQRFTGDDPR